MSITKKDHNSKLRFSFRYLLALQLLPICLVLSPYLYIVNRNIEQFAFTTTLLVVIAVSYIFLNIVLLSGALLSRCKTLKVSFAILVFFLLINLSPFLFPDLLVFVSVMLHIFYASLAIWFAIKIDVDKILFIFTASALLLALNVSYNAANTIQKYQNEYLRSALTGPLLDKQTQQNQIDTASSATETGNVYHIVLDGFQTDAYRDSVALYGRDLSDDFVHVDAFQTSYTVTSYSLTNVLHGEYHSSETDLYDWQYNSFQNEGLYYDLAKQGVGTYLYPYYSYFCAENAMKCNVANPYHDPFVAKQSVFQIVDLWFQYFVPSFLNKILCEDCRDHQDAQARTDFGFSITDALSLKSPDFVPVNFMPYYSMKSVDAFIKSEAERPRTGQYVFMHIEIPHPPYIYDENCATSDPIEDYRYKKIGKSFYDYYVMQSSCGIKILNNITSAIKSAGGYEDALIIVHSDHGFKFMKMDDESYKSFFELDEAQKQQADQNAPLHQELLRSFSEVIFFIKPPNGIKINPDMPLQPIDIAPTIMAHFGLDTSKMEGLNLSQLQTMRTQDRDAQKLYFNFFKMPELVPDQFLSYERQSNRWNATEGKPLTWKGKTYYE